MLVYWKLPNGNYIVKLKKDDGLGGDNDVKITLPSHLGSFLLSNSKRIMNNFIREITWFYNNSIYWYLWSGWFKQHLKIAAASRNSKQALSTLPDLITFYNTGRDLYLGKFVEIML